MQFFPIVPMFKNNNTGLQNFGCINVLISNIKLFFPECSYFFLFFSFAIEVFQNMKILSPFHSRLVGWLGFMAYQPLWVI